MQLQSIIDCSTLQQVSQKNWEKHTRVINYKKYFYSKFKFFIEHHIYLNNQINILSDHSFSYTSYIIKINKLCIKYCSLPYFYFVQESPFLKSNLNPFNSLFGCRLLAFYIMFMKMIWVFS